MNSGLFSLNSDNQNYSKVSDLLMFESQFASLSKGRILEPMSLPIPMKLKIAQSACMMRSNRWANDLAQCLQLSGEAAKLSMSISINDNPWFEDLETEIGFDQFVFKDIVCSLWRRTKRQRYEPAEVYRSVENGVKQSPRSVTIQ